jgi:TOMM system kinase/cyclase fusion protein
MTDSDPRRETPLPPGSRFRGYQILSELGSGGFGRVYKARRASTGQLAAIKVLRFRENDSDEFVDRQRRRFLREMHICAHLSHPHIVRLIDHSRESDPVLYAVFDYVSGDTLDRVLEEEGALDPREAVLLMSQVLDGLVCAHERSVVHRDLKPANIIVTKTGARRHPMILDFGLGGFEQSRVEEQAARITMTHEGLGTPAYAAPEQLRGEPPTARCDLYSWGLIFIECLTGQRVIEGRTLDAVVHKQLGPEPLPIPASVAGGALGPLLASVTEKNPLRREHSASAVFEALDAIPRDRILADGAAAAAAVQPAPKSPTQPSDSLAHLPWEKRQLTVLSCRVRVTNPDGSAPEPEEHARLLRLHLANTRDLVERRGGTPCGVLGTRMLAVFGYPRAAEDATGRAARCALRIIEDLQASPVRPGGSTGVRVEVHVGIHTGLEVVPAPHPELELRGELALGSTPDIACALDELAGAGEILLSEASARLVRGEPPLQPHGEHAVRGLDEQTPVFRVASQGEIEPEPTREPELVGRSAELRQLEQARAAAEAGSPQVQWIRGDAGIGKSRLLQELRTHVSREAWVECHCSPEAQNSPLRPIVDALAGVLAGDDVEAFLERNGIELAVAVPVLCSLLSLPLPAGYQEPPMGPEKRKETTFQCLLDLLFRIAERRPLVFVVEDLHWADPTTRELLVRMVDDASTWELGGSGPLYLCVLLSSRLELEPWRGLLEVPLIQLSNLTPAEARGMVKSLFASERPVPDSLVETIVNRADGVPLFLEEVAGMMRDGPEAAADSERRFSVEIPANLRDLLAVRLDRLPADVRETAQRAACLGREFHTDVLEAVTPLAASELRLHLDALVASGLVHRRSGRQANTCFFKHGLVRDAAYESVVSDRRRHLHETIARSLAERFPELATTRPEVLAHHFERAGLAAEACRYWSDAGRLARSRWANAEASLHWQRGIELLRGLPESDDRLREELRFQRRLGNTLMTIHGYASAEVEPTFTRALEICTKLGDPDGLFQAINGLWGFHVVRADTTRTRELAREQAQLAEQTGRPYQKMAALHSAGVTAFYAGELGAAWPALDRAQKLWEALPPKEWARLTSAVQSPTSIPCYVTWCQLLSGRPDSAVRFFEGTLERIRKRGNPYLLVETLNHGIAVWHDLGEPSVVRHFADEVIVLCREHGFGLWRPVAESARGWSRVLDGEVEEGLRELARGFEAYRRTGARTPLAYRTAYWVEALLAAGRVEEGLAKVEQCLDEFAGNLDRFYDAEIHRLRGELLRRSGEPERAAESYRIARDLARRQGARWLELRACLAAARQARDEGHVDGARADLEALVQSLTEGAETRDLREARALLNASA